MKKMFTIASLFICFLSISSAQFSSQNLPVDTITSGEWNDKHPALTRSFGFSNLPHWMVFERHTADSSFIVGKRFFIQKNVWDSVDVVIASSSVSEPLTYPVIDLTNDSRWYTFCTVWQKRTGDINSIYYSFYNDSIGHWTAPVLLAGDSVSNEHPIVRMTRKNYQKSYFTVVWTRKNILLHSLVSLTGTPAIDTIAQSNIVQPKFDVCDYNYSGDIITVHSIAAEPFGRRLCKTIFSGQPFAIKSVDTLSVVIESASSPRFVQSYGPIGLIWEENSIAVPRLVGSSLFNFNPQTVFGTVDGMKYDVRTFSPPVITMFEQQTTEFLYFSVLSYTLENGIDTSLMIHGPGTLYADTIRSKGYNSSSSIGSFFVYTNGTYYSLVVWESNRTGKSHIYGKLIYTPLGDVPEEAGEVRDFVLSQNYPNPFNPSTVISYQIPVNSYVTLKIYDAIGREVATVVNETKEAGNYTAELSMNDYQLSSGVYFYRMTAGKFTATKKMSLLK